MLGTLSHAWSIGVLLYACEGVVSGTDDASRTGSSGAPPPRRTRSRARSTRTAACRRSGTPTAHARHDRRRRHGRRRLRPLPPLARGRRPARRAGPERVPVLDRLAASSGSGARSARGRALRPADRRAARARDRAGRDALPLGSAAVARGRGRLAEPRHRRALRRVRAHLLRRLRRPGAVLADDQRAVDRRAARLPARPARAGLQGRPARRGDRVPPPAARPRAGGAGVPRVRGAGRASASRRTSSSLPGER